MLLMVHARKCAYSDAGGGVGIVPFPDQMGLLSILLSILTVLFLRILAHCTVIFDDSEKKYTKNETIETME